MEVEDFSSTSENIAMDITAENIPMDITYNTSEKTATNSDSEVHPKFEINKSLLHKDIYLFTDRIYITWENNSNICWLDASMALLVHNQTMRSVIKLNPDCQVSQIIKFYDDAITTLNDLVSDKCPEERLSIAREKLQKVQESSLAYLQPLIKCKKGEPDSAFCSLLNLIKEDKSIQKFFDVTYAWVTLCEHCEIQRVINNTKPIITISNVDRLFVPEDHCSPTVCRSCMKKGQKMKLVYQKLPACLIFHFENGAGNGADPPYSFFIESREYQLTGVMVYEKSLESVVNHFVTYVRDPSVNKWLECNDLNLDIVSFLAKLPNFNLKDVYMYVYEAFDDLETITTKEDALLNNPNEDIPFIDISDERSDGAANIYENEPVSRKQVSEPEENIENIKKLFKDYDPESNDSICDPAHKTPRSVSKDCFDSKVKNSPCSEFMLHKENTENRELLSFSEQKMMEENMKMKENTEHKLSGKNLINRAVSKVVTPVSNSPLATVEWFAKVKKKSIDVDQRSHMPKNITNTGSTKCFPVTVVKKDLKILKMNSTVENTESLHANKSCTDDVKLALEKNNINETSNLGVTLASGLNKMTISSQNKNEVSKNDMGKNEIEKCVPHVVTENLPYGEVQSEHLLNLPNNIQPMLSASNINRSEVSDDSKIQTVVSQKEDPINCNFMTSQVLDCTKNIKKTLFKSNKGSLVLEKLSPMRETSVSFNENISDVGMQTEKVASDCQSAQKKITSKSLSNENIDEEFMNELSMQKCIKREVTSLNEDKGSKQINLESNGQSGKMETNLLLDTSFKMDKICFSADTGNYSVSGSKQNVLKEKCNINSDTGGSQLLLRMQKASLKKPKNYKSDSSCVPHETVTSKNNFSPDSPKHTDTDESDNKMQKLKKKILRVKFEPKSHRSNKSDGIMTNKESFNGSSEQTSKSPLQHFANETGITNSKNVPDMNLSNARCNVLTTDVEEVSKSTYTHGKKSNLNSKPKTRSISINDMLKEKETSIFDSSVKRSKFISQVCSQKDNSSILKGESDPGLTSQRSKCYLGFKKHIKSPMEFHSSYTSENENDVSVPSCSYSVNEVCKERHTNFSSLKNHRNSTPIYMDENESDTLSEAENIVYQKKRAILNNSASEFYVKSPVSFNPSNSSSQSHERHLKSCVKPNCTCKETVGPSIAVDIMSDCFYIYLVQNFFES